MLKHLASAILAIRRAPYQALAALLILWITFFVGYAFSVLAYGSELLLRYFETRPQITAYFKVDANPTLIQQLADSMQQKPYVKTVTVISKEKALQIYRENNQKDPLLLELVTADILPASIEVSAQTPQSLPQINDDLQHSAGVDEVVYQKDLIDGLQRWTRALRYIGITSIILLVMTSFLIIVIITGMKVATKRRTIQIMRILGASQWYIRAPFVYEGMIYGLFGSTIGWVVMFIGMLYLTPWLTQFLGSAPILPLPALFFVAQFGIGTVIGITLGAFASLVAVQRMVRHI